MNRDIVGQLKMLKHSEVRPSEAWLNNNREILLSQIKNTMPASRSGINWEGMWQTMAIFLPGAFVYKVVRPVMVTLLILSMGVGGWIATVDASSNALPGDWLYSTKRATEQTQVVVANVVGAQTAETKLHVEFAKRRALETQQIINDPEKLPLASATLNDLKDEINAVNNKLESIKTEADGAVSAQDAKTITQNADQIKDVLKDVKTDLLVNASTTENSGLTAQVAEAKELTKDTAVKAVEVMVAKHLQGDTSISKEEVKEVISNQLLSSVNEVVESKQNTEDVKKAVDAVQVEVKAIAAENKNVTPAVASSTAAMSVQIDAAVKTTQDAVDKTSQISSDADKKVAEITQLLSQDNLAQAVDTMKSAADATKEAEKISDNTIKSVQSVLPVVTVVKETGESPSTSAGMSVTTTPITTGTLGVTTTDKSSTTVKSVPAIKPVAPVVSNTQTVTGIK
jgi:hypothetical protein